MVGQTEKTLDSDKKKGTKEINLSSSARDIRKPISLENDNNEGFKKAFDKKK